MPVRTTYRDAAIRNLLTGPTGPVVRTVDTITRRTGNAIRTLCPVDTGELRGSFREILLIRGQLVVGRVYSPSPVARYQNNGTKGAVAKPGKVLVFKPKGSSDFVYTKRTRGVKALHFMERGLKMASPWPVNEYSTPR